MPIIIAIDGHSSSGKSTIAKELAAKLGFVYVDTGAMYRAVTLYSIEQGLWQGDELDLEKLRQKMSQIHITFGRNAETKKLETYLNGRNVEHEIRGMEVSNKVSPIATIDFVREALVKQQQAMGEGDVNIVMDGRDVGTTIFPHAQLKFFVTASAEVRAQRRFKELQAKGDKLTYEEVLANVMDRDQIDSTRAISPLVQAPDALLLDNSNMTLEEQNSWIMARYEDLLDRL